MHPHRKCDIDFLQSKTILYCDFSIFLDFSRAILSNNHIIL